MLCIENSGATNTAWPRARSVSAVRVASGSGRVTSRRMSGEEIGGRAAPEFSDRLPAKRFGIAAVTRAARLMRLAAVRPQDHAAKRDRTAVEHRMSGDRGAAGTIEHGEERALAGERHAVVGVIDLGQQFARARVVDARLDGDRALPDR